MLSPLRKEVMNMMSTSDTEVIIDFLRSLSGGATVEEIASITGVHVTDVRITIQSLVSGGQVTGRRSDSDFLYRFLGQ